MLRPCVYAVFAIAAAACGGSEKGAATPRPEPVASASAAAKPAPAPTPHDRAEKLVASSTACLVGQLWTDALGGDATAAQRAATSRTCADVVRTVAGQEDPGQVEALRMLESSIVQPLEAKVKELAAGDGLDDARAATLAHALSAIVAASREAAAARRATAKLRADIEKLGSDRAKRAARDRVATRLGASDATAVPDLRAASALAALVRLPVAGSADGATAQTQEDEATADAHAAGLVLALVRARAAQDLPRHIKLYAAAPAMSVVFGVPAPALPDRPAARLVPGAWLAYVTAVAKACGHPVPPRTPAKEREQLAWTGVLAGFADRLEAAQAHVKNPELAAMVTSAAASAKPATL